MTGTQLCTFCTPPEDLRGTNLVKNCHLSDGKPCLACRDYMTVEDEISAAKQALHDLIIKRSKIRTRVNKNHDSLTCRFPEEIVCSVFESCTPANWDSLNAFEGHKRSDDHRYSGDRYGGYCYDEAGEFGKCDREILAAPLLLGKICKHWRDIAWGWEPLWTTVRMHITKGMPPHRLSLFREWLERAGQYPLSIRVSYKYPSPADEHVAQVTQLLALVNERSPQWRKLDIFGRSWLIFRLKGASGGAPNLQTLRISSLNSWKARDDLPFSLTDTARKPRPSQLSIHDYSLHSIHTEWSALTNVLLSSPSLDDAIELLRIAPNVVSYTLHEIKTSRDTKKLANPSGINTHWKLESLEITCCLRHECQAPEIVAFFKTFLFPNLKYLKVESNHAHAEPDRMMSSWDPVISHLAKSSTHLVSLSILHLSEKPFTDFIIPVLQVTPFLRDLELFMPFWSETIFGDRQPFMKQDIIKLFKLLADTETQTQFLPDLQSIKLSAELAIGNQKNQDEFWSHVLGIFEPFSGIHDPRRRPLNALHVEFTTYVSLAVKPEHLSQMLRLQEAGVILDIMNSSGDNIFEDMVRKGGKDSDADSDSE